MSLQKVISVNKSRLTLILAGTYKILPRCPLLQAAFFAVRPPPLPPLFLLVFLLGDDGIMLRVARHGDDQCWRLHECRRLLVVGNGRYAACLSRVLTPTREKLFSLVGVEPVHTGYRTVLALNPFNMYSTYTPQFISFHPLSIVIVRRG